MDIETERERQGERDRAWDRHERDKDRQTETKRTETESERRDLEGGKREGLRMKDTGTDEEGLGAELAERFRRGWGQFGG